MGGAASSAAGTVTDAVSGAADAVGGAVQGTVDAVGSAGQGVVDLTKDVASSDLGKAAIIAGAAYMGADAAGALGETGAADAATTAAVTEGAVTETPLGSLTAETGAGAAAADAATGGGGGAAASVGASEQIGEKLSGNMGTSAIADYALTAGGTAALLKATTPQVVQQSSVSGQTTTPSIDFTANEKRASADEISNVMAFQSTASQRTRMTGASVLANNAGSATTGAKKLLGA